MKGIEQSARRFYEEKIRTKDDPPWAEAPAPTQSAIRDSFMSLKPYTQRSIALSCAVAFVSSTLLCVGVASLLWPHEKPAEPNVTIRQLGDDVDGLGVPTYAYTWKSRNGNHTTATWRKPSESLQECLDRHQNQVANDTQRFPAD